MLQEVLDVSKATAPLIYPVNALTGAVEFSSNLEVLALQFESLDRNRSFTTARQAEDDLNEARGLSFPGAAEDHVVHSLAAQASSTLDAQSPPDGVCQVGLSAAIGTDDDGRPLVEDDPCLLSE